MLEAGKLYYLSISKKISLLDQVSQAGRSSDLTRADHRGQEALQSCSSCCLLPCVSIVREKIKASSTPAVTSVGYFSVWGMKVEEEVKAKHSFVSQPKCLSEFFGKTLVCNFNFTLIWMVITKGYIQIMCLTLTKLTSYHYNPWTVNVCANIYNLAESELHPSSLFMPEFLEYKLCIFCKSCENQKHAPSCQHSTVLQKHFWKIPTWEIAEKSREEDFKGKDWQHVFFKCLTEGKINL